MNEKPNYYSIIPATVRYDSTLKDKAKLLYSEITSLANKTGECWASDKYFASLYNVSDRIIRSYLKQLKEKKYIDLKYEYVENSKEIKQRIIKIIGVEQTFHTYGTNVPICVEQTFLDNNKYINNKKEINKEKKELFISILNESNLSENMKSLLRTWLDYKEQRNDMYKSEIGFKILLSTVNNQLKEHSEEDLIDVINESMASNYKGITFNKLKYKPRNNFNNSTPTTVNDDGVFRIL